MVCAAALGRGNDEEVEMVETQGDVLAVIERARHVLALSGATLLASDLEDAARWVRGRSDADTPGEDGRSLAEMVSDAEDAASDLVDAAREARYAADSLREAIDKRSGIRRKAA